ncbi:MAG: zinc ribbon domain-containing protein [Phycisphaerae bacterium]|nr:zinc ribbon domain-containing protein [Phycisphaerae bacterium]
MPTYEYYCEENGRTIEVLHGMNDSVNTWEELCKIAGIDCEDVPKDTSVERKLFAVSLLPKKGEGPRGSSGGGCCGGNSGGCGCGGH